jgi:septal ring factor EnvC (AmiA/AmiB activator)
MQRYMLAALAAVFLLAGPVGCGKKEIEELKGKVAGLEKELADTKDRLAARDKDMEDATAKLQESQHQVKALTDQLVKVKVERDKYKKELAAAKKKR